MYIFFKVTTLCNSPWESVYFNLVYWPLCSHLSMLCHCSQKIQLFSGGCELWMFAGRNLLVSKNSLLLAMADVAVQVLCMSVVQI